MDIKRLFFGFEVVAPWPEKFPSGRLILEENRHLTLAFIGDASLPELQSIFPTFPKPPFSIGLTGIFDKPLFLPAQSPRAAAWHIKWLERESEFSLFQKQIAAWLKENGLSVKGARSGFLPHVTMARRPFSIHEWRKNFERLPMYIRSIHLCESLGNSQYEICWDYPILAPFEEIDHAADIAFLIRGENFSDLHLHAQHALSFHFPPLIDYFSFEKIHTLEEIVQSLNQKIAKVDQELGSPFKAVTFHGAIEKKEILEWEMIVDV